MGQQFYVIRRNPAPGTPAFKAKQQRDAAKGKSTGVDAAVVEKKKVTPPARSQPKKKTRSQRKKGGRR